MINDEYDEQDRDSLSMWAEMIRGLASAHKKATARTNMIKMFIFLSCDDKEKEMIRKTEKRGILKLKGSWDDQNRTMLVYQILQTTAKEYPTARIE